MAKPWADTPFALLPTPGHPGAPTCSNPDILAVCVEMANVHNCLLRGLNSIYLQAPFVTSPADVADLMFYTHAWAGTVHHHHSLEEKHFFPEMEILAKEAGLTNCTMESNLAQHHAFEKGLEETMKWVEEVREGKQEFDSKKLVSFIDSFAPTLTQHLHDEIGTLVKLEKCDGKRVAKAMKTTAEAGLETAVMNVMIPQVLGCVDRAYPGSGNFPPVPGILLYLNAYWYSRKHQGAWRFNPCDHWGKKRPLLFLPESE
ncbi:hypothetical protein DE146DRAFT_275667 [Phaeosphaeria sp. MPI-PUGE-AT-0046c]|nr:hypothetical protein DE146DRAFT_275667 [Phaeosphaeria sp. MPI-PUGE-AT-0046c]